MFEQVTQLPLPRLNLNVLLRAESVARVVLALKIGLVLGCFVLVTTLIREFLEQKISTLIEDTLSTLANSAPAPLPTTPVTAQHDYSSIVDKNIFGKIGVTTAPVALQPPKPVSQLQLSLVGTFVSDHEKPYAIIENLKKHEQDVFWLGETVFGEAVLKSVFFDRIEIERNGEVEVLNMDSDLGGGSGPVPGGVASVGQDEFVVQESELDKALDNLPLLLQQARAVPYFKDGKSVGLRLFAIKPDSLFAKIGLNNGDILREVNGKSLADPTQALSLFQELKDDRSISVSLERAGQSRQFKYQIR